MKHAVTHAYIASDELAAAWRKFSKDNAAAHQAIIQWSADHPDAPAVGVRSRPWGYGQQVSCFIRKSTKDPVPEGFCKPQSINPLALHPYERKPSGQPWRDLLATVPRYPQFRHDQYGIRDADIPNEAGGWGSHWSVMPTFRDINGVVYVTAAAEHPKTPHLTPIPLSQYYSAIEAAEPVTA